MDGSDSAAVARARGGDSDAFRTLVERYGRKIFRLAYRMTGNEQDAEDVVQETFLRAYRRLDQFESRANFGTWLYRIAVNSSLDLRRSPQRQEEYRTADPGHPDTAGCSEETLRLASSEPTPDRLAFSTEVRRELTRALARLSAKERAAFVLRHFEGMSIEEIGRVLGLRSNATKNNIFRAVRKLRERLEPLVSSGRV